MKPEPTARLTAIQALEHPWLANTRVPAPFPALSVIERLKCCSAQNKVKRLFLRKLAQSVFVPQRKQLLDLFSSLDPIHAGAVTVEGLEKLLSSSYSKEALQGTPSLDE